MSRRRLASWRLGVALIVAGAFGCSLILYRTPATIETWQSTDPPVLDLAGKARAYQERLERLHQRPDGLIRYKVWAGQAEDDYGNLADGSFFLGIYFGSQALRYGATGSAQALEQVEVSWRGMKLLAEVSGDRGLLARYATPQRPSEDDERWRPSPTHAGYHWRSDVSKDQYAGFVHGLAVGLAALSQPRWRERLAPIAAALADHLMTNDLRLVDWDGEATTHGNLRGRILGFPIGVNAMIALAVAKTAALATDEPRYVEFYDDLIERGYARIARQAHLAPPWYTKRVNQNMAFLALYPLLQLEEDEAVLRDLREALCRLWEKTRTDRNAFFAFVRAANEAPCEATAEEARELGRAALQEFPDRKVGWPVDLTRPGFDFGRSLVGRDGRPRGKRPVPLYLRPLGSSLWVSDPYVLAGSLRYEGDIEYAGIDYLSAYWIARYHGLVDPDE